MYESEKTYITALQLIDSQIMKIGKEFLNDNQNQILFG